MLFDEAIRVFVHSRRRPGRVGLGYGPVNAAWRSRVSLTFKDSACWLRLHLPGYRSVRARVANPVPPCHVWYEEHTKRRWPKDIELFPDATERLERRQTRLPTGNRPGPGKPAPKTPIKPKHPRSIRGP